MLRPRTLALRLAVLSLSASGCFTDLGGGDPTAPASTGSATTSAATTGLTDPDTGAATSTGADATTGLVATGGLLTTTTTSTTSGCDDVWYFDIDGDGYGGPETQDGCGPAPPGYTDQSLDCDDTDPDIHPGADEVCDGADNDCDVAVDEYPAGAAIACDGCRALEFAGRIYYVCEAPQRSWQDARVHCQSLLADLVIVDSKDEQAFLGASLTDDTGKLWIGLRDAAVENTFVWVDGAPLTEPAFWLNAEPNNMASDAPGEADCVAVVVELISPGWRDQSCASLRSFVCEGPA